MTNATNFRPDAARVTSTGSAVKPVWQVNQVLQARVIGQGSDRLYTLRIGTMEFSARSDHPLTIGAHLTLQVTKLVPQPALKVIATENRMPKTAGTDPATAATRQLLPLQTALPAFFALLKAANAPGRKADFTAPLKETMHAILEQTPASELTAKGIKRAISDSGLFLEAKLLQSLTRGGPVPELDLKRLLLTLLQRLPERTGADVARSQRPAQQTTPQYPNRQPNIPGPATDTAPAASKTAPASAGTRSAAPSDTLPGRITSPQPQPSEPLPDLATIETAALANRLRQQVEGTLARLTLHQVHTAKNAEEGVLNWALEMPVLHKGQIHVVPLTVERRTRPGNSEGEPSWRVKLALDTPQFGFLYATILWRCEQVSSVFWAERDSTADLVQHHLDRLRNALTGQGLAVKFLECRKGKPTDAAHHSAPQSMLYGKA